MESRWPNAETETERDLLAKNLVLSKALAREEQIARRMVWELPAAMLHARMPATVVAQPAVRRACGVGHTSHLERADRLRP